MNAIQFNLARILGPTIGGLAYYGSGTHLVLRAEWAFLYRGDHLSVHDQREIRSRQIERERIWASMKEGFQFIRQQGRESRWWCWRS